MPSNPHWERFATELAWFLPASKRLRIGALTPPGKWLPSERLAAVFPRLSRLLAKAHTSQVEIDDDEYVLFSWQGKTGISSWLSPPPNPTPDVPLLPIHRTLLAEFGGVTERSGEPDGSWLMNSNQSLTLHEARRDASFIVDYSWAFEEVAGGIPIRLADYYSISREANGNDTLCHRETGEVLLFAPDHSFEHLVPLPGCPPYTLYRMNGAATFTEWVETVAQQWLAML